MRCNQIDEEQATDQITTWKDRDFPRSAFWSPIDQEAAEEFILRFEQSQIDLGQRAPENEDHAKKQADDSQAQRREEIN